VLNDVVFWVLFFLAALTAALVFRVDSMARATYSMLASLLCTAGVVILLGLDFLGIVTVLMMTIEMAVMGVFMVMMMMNPAGLMPMSMVHNRHGAAAVSTGVTGLLVAGIATMHWPARHGTPARDVTNDLGLSLMGPQMLTMATLGMGLFATIVAGVVFSTGRGRYDRYGDSLDARRPADPIGTGATR
jgi:NADH-quinone oxidoreductase subunit J